MINQLAKCTIYISITIDIGFNSINNSVIGNSTLNDVIAIPRLFALSAVNDKVKPLLVVSLKAFQPTILRNGKLINIDNSLTGFSYGSYTRCPFGSLFGNRRKIKSRTKIKVSSTDINQWMLYCNI